MTTARQLAAVVRLESWGLETLEALDVLAVLAADVSDDQAAAIVARWFGQPEKGRST